MARCKKTKNKKEISGCLGMWRIPDPDEIKERSWNEETQQVEEDDDEEWMMM